MADFGAELDGRLEKLRVTRQGDESIADTRVRAERERSGQVLP